MLRTGDCSSNKPDGAQPAVTDNGNYIIDLHFTQIFVYIAKNPGCTYRKIEEAFGLSNAAVNRTVEALGDENRNGDIGFGLVTRSRDPKEGRRYVVHLSARGQAFAKSIELI